MFESRKSNAERLIQLRAKVAIAVFQFYDGSAETVVTSDVASNFEAYEARAQTAIQQICDSPP
jgi:hypothetical protein